MLKIRDWKTRYENNRTRELKKLDFVLLPNKQDGDGYSEIMSEKRGIEILGAWVLMLQVASKCDNPAGGCDWPSRRGFLIRDNGQPHDEASLSRITRASEESFRIAIPKLLKIGWIEQIPQEGATIPQAHAEIPQEGALKGMEEKGKKEDIPLARKHPFERSPLFGFPAFRSALQNWTEEKCKHYHQAAVEYSGSKGAKYLDWRLAVMSWDRKEPFELRGKMVGAQMPQRNGHLKELP